MKIDITAFKEKIGILYLTIFVFIFIYDPPIAILGGNFTTFLALPSICFLLMKILYHRKIPYNVKRCFTILFILCICLLISLFWPLIGNTGDFVIFKTYLIFALVYFPTIFLIVDKFKFFGVFTLENLFRLIVYIATIQSILMLVMFVNVEFKQQIFSILRDDRSIVNMQSGGVRMLGLAYSVVWDLAFLQSIALILIIPLISKANLRGNLIYALCYLLIILSIVLSGRTGFIGVFFSVIFFATSIFSKNKATLKSCFQFLTGVILLVTVSAGIYTVTVPTQSQEIITEKVMPWAFELFLKQSDSGKIGTESSDELKKMYFPISLMTLTVGDARYVDAKDPSHYYMDTDAGYMRHVLFYGVIGSICLYLLYFLVFRKLIMMAYERKDFSLTLMYVLLLLYFYIGHIKGDLFVGASMAIRLILLIYVFNISLIFKTDN